MILANAVWNSAHVVETGLLVVILLLLLLSFRRP